MGRGCELATLSGSGEAHLPQLPSWAQPLAQAPSLVLPGVARPAG